MWAAVWLRNEIKGLEIQGQENLQQLCWSRDSSQAWLESLWTGNPLVLVVVERKLLVPLSYEDSSIFLSLLFARDSKVDRLPPGR